MTFARYMTDPIARVDALCGSSSVRDSMMARAAMCVSYARRNRVDLKTASEALAAARRPVSPPGWDEMDFHCDEMETSFSLNWYQSGFPVYVLTESMAALLSMTRSPGVDMDRAPHPAFLIEVPKRFIPMESKRPTVSVAVESYGAMGVRESAGNVGVIPDSDTVARWIQTGGDQTINEDVGPTQDRQWVTLAVRIAGNAIAYINEHRAATGSASVERVSGDQNIPVYEVRPPRDVVVDRAFRDAAASLVRAGNLNAARGILAHYVRGHWRNQACGEAHQERKLTWVRPHRRGDESLGRVVQRIERIAL